MKVSEALDRRISVRPFKPDLVPGSTVLEILAAADPSKFGSLSAAELLTDSVMLGRQ
jgi:hypothetical protein